MGNPKPKFNNNVIENQRQTLNETAGQQIKVGFV